MRDTFSDYHPIVNILFFISVTGFAMFLRQPVCLVIAILSALVYSVWLYQGKWKQFLYLLPFAFFMIIMNPLVNHQGITILGYFPGGNPFTLESVIYGVVAAGMLCVVMLWFSCFHRVITTDKWTYLFGRILPALSLVLSMILRFIPRYVQQFKSVLEAQRQLGKAMGNGKLRSRMKTVIRVFSVMLTWTMEHGIETANSMKARGYGLPGRTAFSLYRWSLRDTVLLIVIALLDGIVLTGIFLGKLYWVCFPMVIHAETDGWTILIYIAYGGLMILPMVVLGMEHLQMRKEVAGQWK